MIHFIGNAECPVKHGCAADNISNIHAIHIWCELLPFLCLCINNIRKHKLLWPLLNMKCQMKIFKFAMTLDPRARGAGLGWAAASVAEYCQPKTTEFCLILWLSRHSRHWLDKAMSLNSEIIINSFLHLDTSSRNIDPFWNKFITSDDASNLLIFLSILLSGRGVGLRWN